MAKHALFSLLALGAVCGTLAAVPPHLEILIEDSCSDCHGSSKQKAGLDLESIYVDDLSQHREIWKMVLHRLRTRQMPPDHLLGKAGADLETWNRRNRYGWTPRLIARGYRAGNFKPSEETLAALDHVMRSHGVTPRDEDVKTGGNCP